MAWIFNTTKSPATVAASITPLIGRHQSGDLLRIFLTQDVGGTVMNFGSSSVTVDATADTLTYSGTDFWTNGDTVVLGGTTAPGGTTLGTTYYVRDLDTTANTFKLASTSGGAAINLTTTGTAVTAYLTSTGANHATPGWYVLTQTVVGSPSVRCGIIYKIAASSSETAPTINGANDDWWATCTVVRGADQTTPFDGFATGSGTSGTTITSPALTTSTAGCLVFHSIGWDGGGSPARFRSRVDQCRNAAKIADGSAIFQSVSYVQQEAATGVATVTAYKTTSTAYVWIVDAIRNATGGARQPDIRPTIDVLRWYGDIGALLDTTTTWQAATSFATSIGTYLGSAINCGNGLGVVASTASSDPESAWGTYTYPPNANTANTVESAAGVGCWVGGTHAISSTDMSGKIFFVSLVHSLTPTDSISNNEGWIVGFSDGTNWVAYQVRTKPLTWVSGLGYTVAIALGQATAYASSGSINWAAVTRVGYFWHRGGSASTAYGLSPRNAFLLGSAIPLTGGGASRPATFVDFADALQSWGDYQYAQVQGSGQSLLKCSVQIGDGGSNVTYFDASATATEFPPAFDNTSARAIGWNANAGQVSVIVKAGASDTIRFGACVFATATQQNFTIDAASSTSATYDFGGTSFVGWAVTWKTGVPCDGATFKTCGPIAFKGASISDCTVLSTTASSSQAAATWDANGATVTRTTIDVTGTSAGYHIELGSSVTAITLNGVVFDGTPGTDKIHVKATSGTVTITVDGTGSSLVAGDVTSDGATVSIVSPSLNRGLAFTGLVAGSKVKVFSTGTDTERFSTASSGTSETWDDATSGSVTVDYVILKAGYEPIRVTGVTVTGAVGTGVQPVPITQVVARWYQASSGLTIGTNAFADATTKKFGLTAASTLQNFACYLLEQWIALGDTGEAYANKAWPLAANGPNSFSWLNGWTADLATYPNTISNLSRDGMRYLDASGNVTAMWAALLSVGVPAGAQVRYQQSDGGTTQSAAVTSGNIDQLVQILSDPNGDGSYGDGYDRRGYLVLKVQESGYDQVEADAVALYGALEDQLYVVGLAPTANGIATGSPGAVTATVTDHGASPVTWHGAAYSITIQSDASGTTLMRWLRYNFEAGGTFQGADAFNWHDLIQTNGSAFKTVRGAIYGDTGAALKGVRVITSGGDDHPDFTLYTADDGSTYAPVIPAAATATVLADSRVVLYNVTADAEIDNTFVSGTAYSYTITTEATSGDQLALYVFKEGYSEASASMIWSGASQAFVVSQSIDAAIDYYRTTESVTDYTTLTEFNFYAPSIYIQSDDPDGASTLKRLFIYYNGVLTTEDGARYMRGGITFRTPFDVVFNRSVVPIAIDNVSVTLGLYFTDEQTIRVTTDDGTSWIAPPSAPGSIRYAFGVAPGQVETGVSGLTGSESAQLMGLPSATATATAVWSHALP